MALRPHFNLSNFSGAMQNSCHTVGQSVAGRSYIILYCNWCRYSLILICQILVVCCKTPIILRATGGVLLVVITGIVYRFSTCRYYKEHKVDATIGHKEANQSSCRNIYYQNNIGYLQVICKINSGSQYISRPS